jgi:hypothetical protein
VWQPTFLKVSTVGLLVFLGCSTIAAAQSVTLSLGIGQETEDGSVVVPINLVSLGGAQTAAVQWSLSYSSDVTGVAFAAGTAATNAGKSLVCDANACLIYGLNATGIADGVVATVTLQISSHPSSPTVPIQISGVVAATPAGDSISALGVSGFALLWPAPTAPPPNSPILGEQPVPRAASLSPSGSGGLSQTFTFVFSDSQGATNLASAAMLFAAGPFAQNSCLIFYDRDQRTIRLESDDVTGSNAKAVDSSATLQNSQCAIDATSVESTLLSTTITVGITFTGAFAGLKNIYMYGADGDGSVNTGWVQQGTYMVSVDAPPVPTAGSVLPNAGHGITQTFTFEFADSQSVTNLAAAAMLFASLLDVQNSCYVIYDRNLETLQLEWDSAMGADVKPVGSSTLVQNSQCAIGATSMTTTTLSTIISLDITFKGAYTGPKNIYMYGADGYGSTNTGWVQKGTWDPR